MLSLAESLHTIGRKNGVPDVSLRSYNCRYIATAIDNGVK